MRARTWRCSTPHRGERSNKKHTTLAWASRYTRGTSFHQCPGCGTRIVEIHFRTGFIPSESKFDSGEIDLWPAAKTFKLLSGRPRSLDVGEINPRFESWMPCPGLADK